MDFEKRTIAVVFNNRVHHNIIATVGVGSGLAYHRKVNELGELLQDGNYVLTHIRSGMCLEPYGKIEMVTDERHARLWLEYVAGLVNWRAPFHLLMKSLNADIVRSVAMGILCSRTELEAIIKREQEQEQERGKHKC